MLISTNLLKKFKRKTLPLAIASALGYGLYQVPANAALPTSTVCTGTGTVSCELWAKTGSATLTTGVTVPVWGYAAAAADPAGLPGPVLVVNQGDTVTVTLHNVLSEPTALLFQGQNLPPDTVGAAAGEAKSYTFTASAPGTYLYEAGLLENARHQPAMGLYGALVVRPATPNQAYDATTAFNDEALVLVSEIDTALNSSANPAAFDMRKFAPKYFLINGKAHPSPDLITLPDPVATPYPTTGFNLLLRYVNAGIKHHSMALLGLRQKFIANDGSLLLHPRDGVSETIAPGQTVDAITTISPAVVPDSRFAVYDAGMNLNNSSAAGMGGMLTFVALGGDGVLPTPGTPPAPPAPPSDTSGPVTSGITMTPNPSNAAAIALSATGNDTNTGNSNVDAAEYFIDAASPPSNATRGVPMTVASPGAVAIATGSITAPAEGAHSVLVRSHDVAGNWGAFAPAVSLMQDATGPSTTVAPIASNGQNGVNSSTAAARIVASATDNLTNVSAVEGYIDNNTTSVFPFVPSDGSFNSLSENAYADIPLGTVTTLNSGNHVVHVRARDAAGNWGAFTSDNNLLVDKTAPSVTGAVTATPNPAFSSFVLSANATDAAPTLGIAGGEWFEGTDPGKGLGHPMTATGGTTGPWTVTSNENARSLNWAEGNHTVNVRARDAAQNWSASTVSGTVTVQSPIYFSTLGNTNPPGVAGTADDADIYLWNVTANGFAFSRAVDVTAIASPLPAGANVDGMQRVDDTHFYLSFSNNVDVAVPGIGSVQDEDIVYYDNGTWSVFFDGTAQGLTAANLDLDAFTINGSNIYFSTLGNTNPPGVAGTADDADIYLWNGTAFSRAVDVTAIANPLPAGANVDGLKFVDATHFYLSFTGNVTIALPGPDLTVQDEDVVYYNNGTWSVYFDGTSKGLTANNLNIDAFDIP